jgi:phosphoacetylglucosamine mutase
MESKVCPIHQMYENLDKYGKTLKTIDKKFSYGTSGFRDNDELLDKLAFRVAIVTCILSKYHRGLPMGITVTASHNKYTDNGLKIAADKGEPIETIWERYYENIVNSKSLVNDIKDLICNLKEDLNVNFSHEYIPIIVLAYDTRRSSLKLVRIITYI